LGKEGTKEGHERKFRRESFGKSEIDWEGWLLGDPRNKFKNKK
jgi:hypothetical protein